MKTKITEMLGIEYPIIQGGMAWVAEHHLAAAVSEAGGLGLIGGANVFPAQAGPDRKNDAIAQAVKYIGKHLFESLSVEKVADAVSLSPSHFSRLFRSTTGFSPHEYIMLHRIDEAKALLRSGLHIARRRRP